MSAPGIFTPPTPHNEPIKSYAPGTPERAELKARLKELEGERIRIPHVIGGKDVYSDETFEAVEPHHKSHVLADVSKAGPEQVQQAIDAARDAHGEWSSMPWHAERPMSRNNSFVHAMLCGASRTFSNSPKRFGSGTGSVTGSVAKQSSAAPAIQPLARTSFSTST